MRTLILIGVVVGGLVVAGAIHISQSNGQIEISIDQQKVKNVAELSPAKANRRSATPLAARATAGRNKL